MFIEIMAFGMLPSVLVSCLVEYANKKRQRENWRKYIESSKEYLKQRCKWLASDLLDTVNGPLGVSINNDERKTFVQWCDVLFNSDSEEEYKDERDAFLADVKNIQEETLKVLGIVNEYQEVISYEESKKEIELCNDLIYACRFIKEKVKYIDKPEEYKYNFENLSMAICKMFNDLHENYTEAYNSEDCANRKLMEANTK